MAANVWTVDSHFLNVGGGESAIHLLLLNGVVDRAVLIDGGLDTGANAIRVAVDMIKRRYNKLELKFNTVVVTHWDRDHVNGVRKLLITSHAQFIDDTTFFFCAREGQFTTAKKMCVSGAAAPQMLQVNGTNVCRAVTGPDCIGYDLFDNTRVAAIGVTLVQAAALNAQRPVFLVVGAENHFIDGTVGDLPNMNGSSVMAVIVWPAVFGQRNRVSLYTGGDAEEEQEERLLTWLGSRVTARLDATKAGHHGSHFSTKEALLDFDNRAFVISAGKSSGHPSFSVLFFVLALAHARPDGNQLHVLATRVPYWLGKEPGDIGPVDINLSFVADYGDGPIAYSDELDRMTGGTPVVTWLAEAIRTNKTFLAHQKDDIPDLDELIPRPIPARVDGWALPTAGVTDKERDAYYHDAQLQARAVVLQQWRILGQPREGDTEFGDTILVSQNATGIECTPIRLAVPAVVALMTDMIDGADVGVIMGTATDLAAPSTTASKTKASGKLKAGAKHKAPPVAATKYIKPAREADKHGKVVKKFFPNPGKNKSLAAGEAAGRADDLEEWTLGAFVFPDRLPQSHRWLALCLGGEASVTADIGPIAPEIAITAGGLRFTTAAAARVAQFGAGVQPQGALGYDERFSGVLLAVEPAACGTVTLAGLARLLHFPLPEWLAAAVGPIPLSPLATAEARSGIWYAPATANNLTVVRLAMQPDPASDALARLTDLLATGLGSLKVTNAVVRGTCTHELSLVPGDNQIFRQASLGLELDIAWDSGAAGAQGGARPAFASRVALMFTEAGFALDIRLAKDSNILQSLVSWAQGGLHTADTMPDAGGVVDDLRGQLQALSEHIYLHNLSLSFDSASKRFTSFGIALEVAMPVGEGNAPFIAAFRWTHGVYTLSAELWHRRTYGDLPKELYPYWESITEVQPWAERPVPYISIEELIGQDITIPNGFPDTITSAGLSLSFGAGTAELSLHGTVVCADEPGMDAGEIPCLKFEELSLGLTLSASEVTVQLRGVVSADCPPHLLTPRAMRADNKILLHTAIAYSRQDGSNNWDIFASVHNVRLGNLYSFFAKDGTNLVIMDFLSNITIVEAHAEYEYVTSEPSFLKLGGTLRLGKDDSHVELAFDYSHVRGKSWTFDASLINNIKAGAKPITLGDLIHEVVDDISFLPESVQSFSLPVSKVTKVLLSLKSGKDSKVDFSLGIDIGHLKLRLTYNVIVESGEIKGKVGKFSIWMSGGSDEYSVGAFLKFASEKVGSMQLLRFPITPHAFRPVKLTPMNRRIRGSADSLSRELRPVGQDCHIRVFYPDWQGGCGGQVFCEGCHHQGKVGSKAAAVGQAPPQPGQGDAAGVIQPEGRLRIPVRGRPQD
ncbi:hypothetical protein DFH27DRAFT_283258 [Peziza echinospora]|nr:hypothetical protein DFH27DRAFT_283258 [Peziza echinospora]